MERWSLGSACGAWGERPGCVQTAACPRGRSHGHGQHVCRKVLGDKGGSREKTLPGGRGEMGTGRAWIWASRSLR